MKKTIALLLSILIIALLFIGTVIAQSDYVMKMSHNDVADPLKGPIMANAQVLKTEAERLSGGKIEVQIYPAAQLGDSTSALEQLRRGTIEIVNAASGVLASLYAEKLDIFEMPFIFSSREHASRVLDVKNPFIKNLIEEVAEETGIRILSFFAFGPRHLTNNVKPIQTPDDLKGLKIRVQNIVPHMELMRALGAAPTPIPYSELYTSLQTNVVDGQENPLVNIETAKFYQVQDYLTLTGHLMGISLNVVNEKWFQSLPDDIKRALVEADKVAGFACNGFGAIRDSVALENLASEGMEVYAPTTEEIEMFREKTVPHLTEWLKERYGADFVDEFLALVQEKENEIKAESGILSK